MMLFTIELDILQVKQVALHMFWYDSYDYLLLEKTLTFRNVIILIKSIYSKDKNHYYHNIFMEKCLYK